MVAQTKRKKASKFDPAAITNGQLSIPTGALRFDFAEVKFADEQDDGAGNKTIPVSIIARSGNALQHWWFGKCIHDLEGMQPASAKLPFDYCHRDDEVLGFSDSQESNEDGLLMHGVLIPFKDKDRVAEVLAYAAAGFEWQASIYFDSDNLVLEYVPDGMSVEVNGQDFEGPGVVFRQWVLRGAAICPYGYDPATSVQFSHHNGDVAVQFQEATAMSVKKPAKKNKLAAAVKPNRHERRKATALAAKPTSKAKGKLAAAKPVEKPVKPSKLAADEGDEDEDEDEDDEDADELEDGDDTETEDDCDCAGEEGCECEEEEDDDAVAEMKDDDDAGKHSAGKRGKLSPAQKEAKRFVNAFGDKGGAWFAAGLSFEQAQVKFNKQVRKENAALQKKVADQASQLSALRGEETPVSGGGSVEKPKPSMNGLSAGQSKFAATLTMPSATASRK